MLGCYGLRPSEILALTYPDDFDAENLTVHVCKAMVRNDSGEYIIQNYNKTVESTRYVPISKELLERISAQGYVYNGHPDRILKYLYARQEKLGIPRFKFHALRHYFATELDQAGFSSKDIQKLGGWSSDSVLKTVYQHNRIEKDREMQRKAADLISGNLS
jgi:integrase